MATNKKNVKVRDLKPSKDAKGGGASVQGHGLQGHGLQGHGLQGHGLQGSTKNNQKHQGHGGSGHN